MITSSNTKAAYKVIKNCKRKGPPVKGPSKQPKQSNDRGRGKENNVHPVQSVKELLGLEAISQQAFIFLSNGRCCADRNL